ncbi:unnamed protein product [Xylocopa violacea]|uniref:Uncharacterized protein n=1 Tax=Xylocopa violacea TaxID=135666 RepID=A0ABP1NP59_XYLVO
MRFSRLLKHPHFIQVICSRVNAIKSLLTCNLFKVYVHLLFILMRKAVLPHWFNIFIEKSVPISFEQLQPLARASDFISIAKYTVSAFGIFTLYWNLLSNLPSTKIRIFVSTIREDINISINFLLFRQITNMCSNRRFAVSLIAPHWPGSNFLRMHPAANLGSIPNPSRSVYFVYSTYLAVVL